MERQGKESVYLDEIIKKLAKGVKLPAKNKDHKLHGNWKKYRECHIEPDWLLIYHRTKEILILERTGSHPELFK